MRLVQRSTTPVAAVQGGCCSALLRASAPSSPPSAFVRRCDDVRAPPAGTPGFSVHTKRWWSRPTTASPRHGRHCRTPAATRTPLEPRLGREPRPRRPLAERDRTAAASPSSPAAWGSAAGRSTASVGAVAEPARCRTLIVRPSRADLMRPPARPDEADVDGAALDAPPMRPVDAGLARLAINQPAPQSHAQRPEARPSATANRPGNEDPTASATTGATAAATRRVRHSGLAASAVR